MRVASAGFMSPRWISLALAVVILGAGAFAILHPDGSAPTRTTREAAPLAPAPSLAFGAGSAMDPSTLPPGHPSIGGAESRRGGAVPAANDSPAIAWMAPAGWTSVASPTAMRLATYRVPHAAGDTEDAEATVTRAGGTTDANIERWLGQFDDRGKDIRTERDVRGMKVTVVDVSGTYLGGGMGQPVTAARPGWALLGAIVENSGASYFVKVTGPAATVRSARGPLNALLGSVTPI